MSVDETINRLKILKRKLEMEGLYVSSLTCEEAVRTIKELYKLAYGEDLT